MRFDMDVNPDELAILNANDVVYYFYYFSINGNSSIYFESLQEYNNACKILKEFD